MKGQHNTKKIKKLEIKTDNFKSGLDTGILVNPPTQEVYQ